jgi:transcriptional regulator with XRE-family HTH domain
MAGSRLELQLLQPANSQGFVAFLSVGRKALKARKPMPYPEVPATLGDHLRIRRHERGLLQKDAAASMGVNTFTLANWEKGYTNPRLRFWPGIIEFLAYDPRPEPKPSDLAQRTQWTRRRRGLSLRALAVQLGVDPETLRRWECGMRTPRGKYLALVERFLEGHRSGGWVLRTHRHRGS